MTLTEKLQQIISQSEEATPGPWKQHGIKWNGTSREHFAKITSGEAPSESKYSRPVTVGYFHPCDLDERPFDQDVQQELPMEANAAFIASSRVLVPALARALGVAVKQLEMYGKGQHFEYCGKEEFAPENPSGEPANILCGGAEGGEFQYEDGTMAAQALAEITKILLPEEKV